MRGAITALTIGERKHQRTARLSIAKRQHHHVGSAEVHLYVIVRHIAEHRAYPLVRGGLALYVNLDFVVQRFAGDNHHRISIADLRERSDEIFHTLVWFDVPK